METRNKRIKGFLNKYLLEPITFVLKKIKFGVLYVCSKIWKYVLSPILKYAILPVLKVLLWPFDKLIGLLALLPSIVIGMLSFIIWGFGQLINRQYVKAAMFFTVFALIIFVEVSTGNYGTELNIYEQKIPGEEMPEEISSGFIQDYYYNLYHGPNGIVGDYTEYKFLEYVAELNDLTIEANPWYVTYNDQDKEADFNLTWSNQEAKIVVDNPEEVSWNMQLQHGGLFAEIGKEYKIDFNLVTDVAGQMNINLFVGDTIVTETVDIVPSETSYTVILESEGYSHYSILQFDFDGTVDDTWRFALETEFIFDNISFEEVGESDSDQIKNGDFEVYLPVFMKDGLQLPESQFGQINISVDDLYSYIIEQLAQVEEDAALGGVGDLEEVATALAEDVIDEKTIDSLLETALRDARALDGYDALLETTKEEIAVEALILLGHVVGETNWDQTVQAYINNNLDDVIETAEGIIAQDQYDAVTFELWDVEYNKQYKTHFVGTKTNFYTSLYGDFAMENESIEAFIQYIDEKFKAANLNMDSDDANKMLARWYFALNPEEYDELFLEIDNHYYERSGFFIKGLWGLVTMGEVPQTTVFEHKALGFILPDPTSTERLDPQDIIIEGHHSTRLLLNGIIAAIALFFLAIVWVWNVRDAYNTSKANKQSKLEQKTVKSERQYYKELYDKFFEYIVLAPAVIIISFISIMPIIFGILVAFTNYNIDHIPPGQLIEWVGFSNFLEIFSFGGEGGINFGGQFWNVFLWTLIWAVGATFTCFFGGFIQAVIISNERVVFRKAWRSVLILPWAVPALISQMIFRVMFQDTGYVNQTLANFGIVDLFHNLGFLGKTYDEAINSGALERFFHMGTDSFQWLSNEANPWFVRIFLIVLNVWLGFPFFMALMSGVMTSIDKSLYEAASIDGATGFQQFRFITMPLVLIATSPLLVMTFSGNFNNFGVIYFITGGGPGDPNFSNAFAGQTDILISWIYRLTTDANVREYYMASVFSLLIFLIIGSVSAWNFTRTRAFKEDD